MEMPVVRASQREAFGVLVSRWGMAGTAATSGVSPVELDPAGLREKFRADGVLLAPRPDPLNE